MGVVRDKNLGFGCACGAHEAHASARSDVAISQAAARNHNGLALALPIS